MTIPSFPRLARCRHCGGPFRPRLIGKKPKQTVTQHCSWTCSQATNRQQWTGKPLVAAIAGRVKKYQAIWTAKLEAQFGVLTDREVELMRRAELRGYRKGYQAAYAPLRRRA